jgi:hypothetical protein
MHAITTPKARLCLAKKPSKDRTLKLLDPIERKSLGSFHFQGF